LYPPVEIDRFKIMINDKWLMVNSKENYYIIISALTEFKKIEIAIEWFNKLNETKDKKPKTKDKKNFNNYNLTIIWVWDYKRVLEKIVTWKNIKFIWAKYWDELVELIQNSFWLIFPWEEDFWIVPIEVLSAWKPVFAYKWWWLLETNITWVTWEFFEDKQGNDFVEKFKKFDNNNRKWKYKAEDCAEQAKKFDKKIFEKRILELVKGEE
jgi:hypothetical protein